MATIAYTEDYPRSPSAPFSRADDDVTDGQLLDRFIHTHDGSAFEELVRRHGRMVLGVCRRVLDNPHDAEDCFQAVFMVLVRKAASVQPRDMVGNWLYGVAYRTALEAKKMAARRRNREKKRCAMPRPDNNPSEQWQDLKPLLDHELSKLPEKYREVLVLSDLEGHTRKEVAQALGVAEGTIASRLARARVLLAKRLARRNLSISAGALAVLLSEHAGEDVPGSLTASTALAASQLSAGRPLAGEIGILTDTIVRSLARSKAKIGAVIVVILTVIGIGIGTFLPSALAERKTPPEKFILGVKPVNKKEKPEEAKDCVVESIDPMARTISAACSNDALGESVIDLHVGPATRIVLDGRDGQFADLRTGMCVHLQWQADAAGRREAVAIEVAGEAVPGIVQALDDATLTVRCENHKGEFIDKKYDLDKDAKVLVNGKKAKLADLKVKMRVTIQVPMGNKTKAVGVKAAGPKVAGSVKAVHADKGTLSLDMSDLHLAAESVPVAPDAAVTIAAQKKTLADLQPGMRVTLRMSAETERSYVVAITCVPVRAP